MFNTTEETKHRSFWHHIILVLESLPLDLHILRISFHFNFLSIIFQQLPKSQTLLILPILPSHISLNVKDAVGTNKHAKPEGPATESEEPKVSEVYSKSMNINKLY